MSLNRSKTNLMEPLILKATKVCPEVTLNPGESIFELSGRSYPEDVTSFYEPIIDWLKEYGKNPLEQTVCNVILDYFNTASSKMLLDIFSYFEDMKQEGHNVEVRWHYADDDENMHDAGKEYANIVDVPFEMVLLAENLVPGTISTVKSLTSS